MYKKQHLCIHVFGLCDQFVHRAFIGIFLDTKNIPMNWYIFYIFVGYRKQMPNFVVFLFFFLRHLAQFLTQISQRAHTPAIKPKAQRQRRYISTSKGQTSVYLIGLLQLVGRHHMLAQTYFLLSKTVFSPNLNAIARSKKQYSAESWFPNIIFGTFSYSKVFNKDNIYPSWSVGAALVSMSWQVDTTNHK